MPKKKTFDGAKAAVISMIVLGIATLVSSSFFFSSFFAIIGFALVFWGAILLYITPTKSVFFDLLSVAAEPSSANLERIITEYNLVEKGIYLPTKSSNVGLLSSWSTSQNPESILVHIPEAPNVPLPKQEENNPRPKTSKRSGIYISPPGQALCKLFEQQIGRSFTRVNFRELQKYLPLIISRDLKLAETVSIKTEKNIITIEIFKSILEGICRDTNSQPRTHKQVGCLLSSAIACALVKSTGEPITIQNETRHPEIRTTQIQYQIMANKED
jgi:hypothetical protein